MALIALGKTRCPLCGAPLLQTELLAGAAARSRSRRAAGIVERQYSGCSSATCGANRSRLSAPQRLTWQEFSAALLQRGHGARVILPGGLCRFGSLSFVDGIRGALKRARRPVNPTGVMACHTSMVS